MSRHRYHKMIWSEGLLVVPQLFQQADRYHESALDFRVRPLAPYGWGAISMEVNRTALEQRGVFMLEAYRGVFPGGTAVNSPDADVAPPGREIPPDAFVGSSDRLGVYLALPVDRPHAPNYGAVGGDRGLPETRYVPEFVRVEDECDDDNAQDIVAARKNLRILFEGEPSDDLECLKIAEVERARDGRLTPRADYIPPCLALAASPALLDMVWGVIGALTARSTALLGGLQLRTPERHEFRHIDPEVLWLLGTINASIPVLTHLCQTGQAHPEIVYRGLAQLAGQLSVLSVRLRAADLPAYDHDDLSASMGGMVRAIEVLLQLATEPTLLHANFLALQEITSSAGHTVLYTASPLDASVFAPGVRFYLVIRAVAVDQQRHTALQQLLPDMATIASFPVIDAYIDRAAGLRIAPTPPPPGAPPRSAVTYFIVETQGAAWEGIATSRTLALYIPRQFRREFARFEAEVLAIQGEDVPGA